MKLFLSLTAVLILVANPALAAETAKICPPKPEIAIPIYRVEKPKVDNFYSTDNSQINPLVSSGGYKRKESVGNIFHNQLPGTIPLHRLYLPGRTDHTYTASPGDREAALKMGYHDEGMMGSLVQYGGCTYKGFKVAPLYRLYNKKTTAHMLTHDDAERAVALKSGFGESTVLGYVLIPF